MSDVNQLTELFGSIGLDVQKAEEAAKNSRLSKALAEAIHEANVEQGCENLLAIFSTIQ